MKRIHVSSSPTRFLLSDTLPYETPIVFSNRNLASFIKRFRITCNVEGEIIKICTSSGNDFIDTELFKRLFDDFDLYVKCGLIWERGKKENDIEGKYNSITIPYSFSIPREGRSDRKLSVIHPLSQLYAMAFFDKYGEIILYYCNRSNYSIRYPVRKASWKFYYDKTHFISQINNSEKDSIEEFNKEYEVLKSYFIYKKYSNVYKFYESEFYNKLESSFSHLYKIDISRFFDSIYTHSICWQLYDKEYIKNNLNKLKNNFGNLWDSMMQRMNYNETNGIVIGPEFSRVFAETIIQRIDQRVEQKLASNNSVRHRVDYEICRYVDDFFVFYNKEDTRQIIENAIREELSELHFYLNDVKTEIISGRPLISDISVTKYQIERLLFDTFVSTDEDILPFVHASKLIQGMKTVLHQNDVAYNDIINYTLAILERKLEKIIQKITKNEKKESNLKPYEISYFFMQSLKFVFFLLSSSTGANSVIRTCRIVLLIINYIRLNHRKYTFTDKRFIPSQHLFDFIYSEVISFINKDLRKNTRTLEITYLLVLVKELGKGYYLPEKTLLSWIEGRDDYFCVISVLFYSMGRKRYSKLTDLLIESIKRVISIEKSRHSERVLMLFDALACPYFSLIQKKEFLAVFDGTVGDQSTYEKLIHFIDSNNVCFTNWKSFNFAKELDLKRGQFVY